MIKNSQVAISSNIAQKVDKVKGDLRILAAKLSKAGLYDDQLALEAIADQCSEAAGRLERQAREAFVAARQGKRV